MKKILLIASILLPGFCFAQNFKMDPDTHGKDSNAPYYLLDTVLLSGYTKAQLYSNGLSFATAGFKDANSKIEIKDLNTGEIFFKNYIVTRPAPGKTYVLFFNCRMYFKDNKFKIVLSGLEHNILTLMDTGVVVPLNPAVEMAYVDMAKGLIKNAINRINQKPESEF